MRRPAPLPCVDPCRMSWLMLGLMLLAAGLTIVIMWIGMRPRAMVPGRLQSAAELSYKFVLDMCVDQIGEEGRKA